MSKIYMRNKMFTQILLVLLAMVALFAVTKFFALNSKTNVHNNANIENISAMKVTIYSKKGCVYCTLAQELLDKEKIPYQNIELSQNHDLQLKLLQETKQDTVPYIFVNDKFIGGYSSLKELLDS